jgi:hypothetical protein
MTNISKYKQADLMMDHNFRVAVFNICYYTRNAGRRHLELFWTPKVISKIEPNMKKGNLTFVSPFAD